MDKQNLVRDLVRRAGIVEPPPVGAGTFAGEAILVLLGRHKSSLNIFDQHGQQIGTAKRSSGRHSRDGYQYRYELVGLRSGLTVTDISKGRFAPTPEDFTIAGTDASHIASAHRWTTVGRLGPERADRPSSPADSIVFLRDGEPIATLWKMPPKELWRTRPRVSGSGRFDFLRRITDPRRLFYVDDQAGRLAARVTYLSEPGYVVELQPDTPELLSTIGVAACLIADNVFISESGGGGGGA